MYMYKLILYSCFPQWSQRSLHSTCTSSMTLALLPWRGWGVPSAWHLSGLSQKWTVASSWFSGGSHPRSLLALKLLCWRGHEVPSAITQSSSHPPASTNCQSHKWAMLTANLTGPSYASAQQTPEHASGDDTQLPSWALPKSRLTKLQQSEGAAKSGIICYAATVTRAPTILGKVSIIKTILSGYVFKIS